MIGIVTQIAIYIISLVILFCFGFLGYVSSNNCMSNSYCPLPDFHWQLANYTIFLLPIIIFSAWGIAANGAKINKREAIEAREQAIALEVTKRKIEEQAAVVKTEAYSLQAQSDAIKKSISDSAL